MRGIEADVEVAPSTLTTVQDLSFKRGSLSGTVDPTFRVMRKFLGPYLVDKTALIERIVDRGFGEVDLVLRPRRCGKSSMLNMIRYH
jgi:Predicted AAA-ATPase